MMSYKTLHTNKTHYFNKTSTELLDKYYAELSCWLTQTGWVHFSSESFQFSLQDGRLSLAAGEQREPWQDRDEPKF